MINQSRGPKNSKLAHRGLGFSNISAIQKTVCFHDITYAIMDLYAISCLRFDPVITDVNPGITVARVLIQRAL